ncbi:hypothetical protein E2K98_00085 [Bacillus salipaludis]|uniref:J domain-containing protein n=1 Tax=Bacillus salipaludis TaxID=2547811 RepID=A0A4R5VYK8_9BACI|nr:hypothetical protein [Bacillus salipaludis]MDQ6597117.1 hypothetical protein [Bacillus salipaludis]TDK64686.1 hypothetical protein E2K98_00085 [Bacillus salipaludis]
MNTDQAYALLMDAGVKEETSIVTIRRWLRERKIYFEGKGNRNNEYIIDNMEQALFMLKDAGVAESDSAQIVGRWLSEGKIKNVRNRKKNTVTDPSRAETNPFLNNPQDQLKIIQQLKEKINAQNEHIKGMEQLHKTSIYTLKQQRDKLNREVAILESEKSEIQNESMNLLRENRDLRNEILKLKQDPSYRTKRIPESKPSTSQPKTHHFRQKLGLSKTATEKEIVTSYKKLLKITHPDHGGNAAAFHYIKTDYDHFRNSNRD